MANTFKKVIDMLMWRQVPPAPNAHAAAACLCSDLRSGLSRNPFVYQLVSATVLNRFNIVSKGWNFVQSPALAGTFGVGAAMAFAPSLGLVSQLFVIDFGIGHRKPTAAEIRRFKRIAAMVGTRGLQFTERKGKKKGRVEFDVSPAPILRKAA